MFAIGRVFSGWRHGGTGRSKRAVFRAVLRGNLFLLPDRKRQAVDPSAPGANPVDLRQFLFRSLHAARLSAAKRSLSSSQARFVAALSAGGNLRAHPAELRHQSVRPRTLRLCLYVGADYLDRVIRFDYP